MSRPLEEGGTYCGMFGGACTDDRCKQFGCMRTSQGITEWLRSRGWGKHWALGDWDLSKVKGEGPFKLETVEPTLDQHYTDLLLKRPGESISDTLDRLFRDPHRFVQLPPSTYVFREKRDWIKQGSKFMQRHGFEFENKDGLNVRVTPRRDGAWVMYKDVEALLNAHTQQAQTIERQAQELRDAHGQTDFWRRRCDDLEVQVDAAKAKDGITLDQLHATQSESIGKLVQLIRDEGSAVLTHKLDRIISESTVDLGRRDTERPVDALGEGMMVRERGPLPPGGLLQQLPIGWPEDAIPPGYIVNVRHSPDSPGDGPIYRRAIVCGVSNDTRGRFYTVAFLDAAGASPIETVKAQAIAGVNGVG